MADITQELGFDVRQALSSLDALNKSISSFNRRITGLGNKLNRFNGQAGQVSSSLERVGTSARRHLGQASTYTERVTVSWRTMVRVVATQVIVKAMRRIEQTFARAAESAIEFQTNVAEIQTIANNTLGTNDQVAASVRRISDAFNLPLDDTARGLYQTVSNQIGKAGENITFLESSAQFAKAGVASLNDSVNLLAGTLNAFELGVEDTDKVASQFFRTIELGRTTASELATSFGRVLPFGKSLGVELSELQGITAGLTVRGVKTSEAMTQLRGILNAFQKPSREMQRALRDLGFQTGAQAIQTLGLVNTIRELNNSGRDFGQIFTRIRGRAGAIAIGKAADEFEELNRKIQDTESTLAKAKFDELINVDGQQVAKDINKIKNALTVDLGQSLLSALRSASELIGGVDNLIAVVKGLGFTLLAVAPGFVGLKALMKSATVESGRLATGLAGVGAGLSLLSAGLLAAGAGTTLGNLISNRLFEDLDKFSERTAKELKEFQEESSKRIEQTKRDIVKFTKDVLAVSRDANKEFIRDTEDAQFASGLFRDQVESDVNQIINARKRLVSALRREINVSKSIRDASQQRSFDIQQSQSDRRFEFEFRGLHELEKFDALLSKANQESRAAARGVEALTASADPQDAQRAIQQFQRAIQFADRARQLAIQRGDRFAEEKAVQSINSLLNKQLQSEERLQEIQTQRAAELEKQADARQKEVDLLKEAGKLLLANIPQGDESPAELARQTDRRRKALKQISDLALSQDDLSAIDVLGLTRSIRDIESDLTRSPIELQFQVEQGVAQVLERFEKAFKNFEFKLRVDVGDDFVDQIKQAIGGERLGPKQLQEFLTGGADAAEKQVKALERVGGIQKRISNIFKGTETQLAPFGTPGELSRQEAVLKSVGQTFKGFFGGPGSVGAENTEILRRGLSNVSDLLVEVSQSGDVTENQIEQLRSKFKTLQSQSEAAGGAFSTQLSAIGNAIKALSNVPALKQSIEELRSGAGSNEQATAFTKLINDQATAIDKLARARQRLSQTPSVDLQGRIPDSQPAPGFAHGGRGTDTVNALLSPGEMVINARQSRRFFTQLQALNAGQRQSLANGGQATSVGDITVNVNESSSARATAREVATTLRREFRRGTTKI